MLDVIFRFCIKIVKFLFCAYILFNLLALVVNFFLVR
uniref:Uncharacterized protein n=1 Tax=Dulem virus 163 TaxID=3145640 RepID=A0AAU8B394_9VIRU